MNIVKKTSKASYRFIIISLLITLLSGLAAAYKWESIKAFEFNAFEKTLPKTIDPANFTIGVCDTAGPIEVEASLIGPGPTAYATLGAAFTAINAGTHTGAVVVEVCGDTSEGATTATLNASGGSSSYSVVIIRPVGGVARTISGATTAGSPMIDLSGADNVTINGINTGGDSLTIANTTVSATSGTSTIRFIGGATGNTITNSNIQGSGTMSVATNGATIFFSTDAVTANGNDNNTISNNNIGPAGANLPTKAILGNGSTTTTAIGNSGNIIDNNNIFDFFGAAVTSSGVATNGGCNSWTITNNRFYQTATRTWTTGATHRAIDIGNTTATSGAQGFTITGNIVGYASNTQTGVYTLTGAGTGAKFQGIVFNGITGGTVSDINSNTVAAVSLTGVTSGGASTSSPLLGIMVINGVANTNSNTIGSQSGTGSLTLSTTTTLATDVYGIFNFSINNWTSNSNNIGGISVTNLAASGTFLVYGMRANTGTAVTWGAASNNVGGTIANSIQLTATGTSSQVVGMQTPNAISTFTSNTIRNLTTNIGTGTTTTASVAGIIFTSTTPIQTVSQNTIHTLTNTNATAASIVTGIQFTGGTANVVERNFIYNLLASTNSATAEINGIRVGGGTTQYRNNMIALGAGITNALGGVATNSSTTGIVGINEALGTNQFFHNSVYIGGGPTAGTGASYAFNGTVTTNTRSHRNNIFFNARNNSGGTGSNYAIKINGTTPNPTGLTLNNNLYFVNGSGGVFGFFNSSDVANLAAWKVAVGQDAGSFESNPQFLDATNAVPDLHLHPTTPTVAEGNGVDVGVTLDFDGQTRSGLTPVDIGADAGNFVGIDLAVPVITYSPLVNTSSTANRIQNVTITDVSGVATGGNAPRIYFNKNGGAYFSTACSLATGTVNNGTWNCTIDNSLIGGVVVTDIIRYFVVAQDIVGNLASNPSAGFTGTDVNTITTPPTTPIQYAIVGTISGSFNVGSGETYTSLTNAGGIFEFINNSEVVGNITINITSDLAGELGTNGLNAFASPFTININPSGAARMITGSFNGALIRMNGASRVTIDGSIGGIGTDRSLTITNTSVTTPNVVLIGSTGTTPVTNDTLKNCIIINGANTSSAVVISDAGVVGNTGFFSNITIQNNDVQKAFVGVFATGGTTPQNGSNLTYTQNAVNTSGANAIRNVGLYMQGVNGATVSNNSVGNFSNAEGENDTGIWLASGTTNATVSGNTVNSLGMALTTGFAPIGIRESSGLAASSNNITGNTVTNLSTTGSTGLRGIAVGSGGVTVQKNWIQGIINNNTGTFGAFGIDVTAGNNNVLMNNFISDINHNMTGGAAFGPDFGVIGIRLGAGTGHQVYNNSVNLFGPHTGTATTSLLSAAFSISTTAQTGIDVRNNIFANNITGGTTSIAHVAVFLPSGGTSAMNLTMNKNAYFYGTDVARQGAGQGGTTAGTNFFTSLATLAAYTSTLHIPVTNDNASQEYTTAPPFVTNTDLHLNDPMSPLVGAGDGIGSVTNDFDMDPRPVSNTDIGADELVQSTAGSFPSGTFYNAILAGSDTLSGDVTIKNTLTLTGISNTGSNTLIIGCNATVNGASATNYVVGTVQKDFCATGAFTFPVGTPNDGMLVGEESSPVTVNVTALGQNPSALRVSATDNFLLGLLESKAVSRYWTLSEVGDLTADLTFQYLDQDINGNESLYKVFRRAGGLTTEQSPNSNNPAANQATVTGVSNFSDWGIGELAPTAAGVEVGGRVVRGDGQGIGRARLVLTDTLGNSRITQTSAFGYYKFEDVEAGQTVTITVSSKQYVFNQPTRVINLGESVTDADFIASGENDLLNNGDSYFDKAPLDFDGDGRTDISVFRADKSSWLINYSSDNKTAKQAFGLPTDMLAPADFDGDGRTDYGVFRASEGAWYIWNSSTNDLRVERFGTNGDVPVPADFDGDLKADLILWNANGWTVKRSSDGRTVEIASENTDKGGVPMLADYDTDGKADLTIFVKSSGTWRILLSSTGETVTVKFGNGANDSAMMGDFDGDFRADFAVYNQGVWTIRNTRTGEISTIQSVAGEAVIGDFDGDNRLDATIYQNGRWTLRQSAGGLVKIRELGANGDLAIPSILVK